MSDDRQPQLRAEIARLRASLPNGVFAECAHCGERVYWQEGMWLRCDPMEPHPECDTHEFYPTGSPRP